MFDPKLSCAFATSVILVLMVAGALFADLLESPTRTIAPSAHDSKKIVMVAPRSSTLGPAEQTYSTRGVV